jgi:DNA (cytosine-5)-methyltransferase 1
MVNCSPTLRAGGHSGSHANAGVMPAIAFDPTQITSQENRSNPQPGDPCHTLAKGAQAPAIAFQSSQSGVRKVDSHATLDANNGSRRHNGVVQAMQVRRLTPRECERLQGFPDDYTAVPHRGKPAADGPRYKALGNSWAVPVVRWIGARINQVEALHSQREEIAA